MDVSRKVCGTQCTPEVIATMARTLRAPDVRAIKIVDIEFRPKKGAAFYGAVITPEQESVERFLVDGKFVQEQRPDVGGYICALEDGTLRFLGEEAFQETFLGLMSVSS